MGFGNGSGGGGVGSEADTRTFVRVTVGLIEGVRRDKVVAQCAPAIDRGGGREEEMKSIFNVVSRFLFS